MKHLVILFLLALTNAVYAQTVVLHAENGLNNEKQVVRCNIDIEFALADSTICISEGGKNKELRIIDYTDWQTFEDFEEPWELQDPMLFYQGRKKYFMAKQEGRREPFDISLYSTSDGRLCLVIDDCKTWTLYLPVTIKQMNNNK